MSLAGSPDYLLRPEENAIMMLLPSVEDANTDIFDDFFDRELYELNNQNTSENQSEDYHNNEFVLPGYNPVTSPKGSGRSPTTPWRKGLWCLTDKLDNLVVNKTRENIRSNQVFVSPTHLTNKQSLPRETSPCAERGTTIETKNYHLLTSQPNRSYLVPVPVLREQTLSPSPMYAQLPTSGSMSYQDSWQEDFQNFHLQRSEDQAGPKPTQGHPVQRINAQAQQLHSAYVTQNSAVHRQPQSPTRYHYPFQHVNTHGAGQTPTVNKSIYIDGTPTQAGPEQLVAMPEPYQYIHAQSGDAPVWVTESLHSSDSSSYSYDSYRQAQSQASQHVWTPPDNNQIHTTIIQTPIEAYESLAAPIPQLTTHYVLQQEQDPYLQYPPADEIGCAVSYEPQIQGVSGQPHYHSHPQPPQSPTTPSRATLATTTIPNNALSSYPTLPPPPQIPIPSSHYTFPEGISPFTPRRQRKSPSRSASPPISPTHNPSSPRRSTNPRSHRRSPSRPDLPHHHQSRRKSISKPGPILTISIPLPPTPHPVNPTTSPSRTRARSRSTSRPAPRTPRTPSSPAKIHALGLDFVNFTQKDAHKLMADVAPSGSSKTRARREQEAKDKRKRLSELAVREVVRVGGDVGALKRAGVIV